MHGDLRLGQTYARNSITLFSLNVFCSSKTENEATALRGNLIHFCLPKRYLSKPIAKAKSPGHFGLADAPDFGSTMQRDIPRWRCLQKSARSLVVSIARWPP